MLMIFTICYSILYWYNFHYIARDELFYNSLAEQLSIERANQILELNKKFRWLSYTSIPLILCIRWLLVATCLYIRFFFYDSTINFSSTIKVASFAEIALVLTSMIKITALKFIVDPQTLEQLQSFTPLSLYSLFQPGSIPSFLVYLLQSLNIFELWYILILSWGMKKLTNIRLDNAVYLSFTSYGVGLLFWIILVVFFQLQFV